VVLVTTTDRRTLPDRTGGAVSRPPRPSEDRAVLVTGGSGYLGSLVLRTLADAGIGPLVSIDVRPPRVPLPGVIHLEADLREHDLAGTLREHRVGAVVHLAAIVDPPPGMDAATLHAIEVGGTRRTIDACLAAGVTHLTVTSSGAAYGYGPANRDRWLVESDPTPGHPRFAYSRHKAEVERLVEEVRRDHPDLEVLLLRPGTVLGETTDNQITALFSGPVVLGLRDTDVPFVFVLDTDVAEVIRRGVVERIAGTFNLAGDGVLTLRDIAALEGKPFVPVPAWLLAGALHVLSRLRVVPYGPEQVDFLRYRPVLANAALKAAFPGLPSATSAEAYARFREGARRRTASR
jgi:UDP-glucose 4-epimerase